MIGIDTNVLLRLLIRDDEVQFARLVAHIEAGAWAGGVVVNLVVLVEAVWVLTKQLRRPKPEVIGFIEDLLATDGLSLQQESLVVRALAIWRTAKCDFADCLIAELDREAGATTTLTYDEDALLLPAFSPVP
ncbi:PIN domain-containing protein [Siculibacillus lacustris]|uniref:PIN domain-containing protein n=1 Tax=Siculibacillus lacustris TaxID=1549641 RepID=A0A4V2KSR1_9HYPH|nr:PIN domain-containing protein [Siculibacillus lacustris]TBW33947.1 PIN domain-containing protein [Siculibacillus lacustris]